LTEPTALSDPDGLKAHLDNRADASTVHSVDKALVIMELLMRSSQALSAREIALQTGINRTTSHRLINSLINRGWIEKEGESASYRLSLRWLILSDLAYQQRNVLAELRPTIEHLSRLTRETVHVGVLDGFSLVHVDKVDSPERVGVSSKIGTKSAIHTASLGKALLAAQSDAEIERYLAYASRLPGPDRLDNVDRLRADLQRTRQVGYSVDDEEDSIGVRCIGAAILAGNSEPVFAISVTGPAGRFTLERACHFAPALIEAATSVSRNLGWASPDPRAGALGE
jgi:IclR family acetate operon transcriptional repressor